MDAEDYTTQPCPIIRPHFTLPTLTPRQILEEAATQPMQALPSTRQPVTQPMPALLQTRRRRNPSIVILELLYAIMALSLGVVAYHSLAAWPVYRIVACAIIAILWSNLAGHAAQRKPIEEQKTRLMRAVRIDSALTQDTMTYLKTIKASMKNKR